MDSTGTLKFCTLPSVSNKKKPKSFIVVRETPDHDYEIVLKKVDRHHNPVYWETLGVKKYSEKKVAVAWYDKIVSEWNKTTLDQIFSSTQDRG